MEHGGSAEWLARTLGELARATRSQARLQVLVEVLRRRLCCEVMVIDLRGSILTSSPPRISSKPKAVLGAYREGGGADGFRIAPVEMAGEVLALVAANTAEPVQEVLEFAASLISLELGRLQARLVGRREIAGRVVEDVVRSRVPDTEAVARLRSAGVDVEVPFRVLVGRVDCSVERLTSIPWNLHALLTDHGDPQLRVVLGEEIVMVLPDDQLAERTARLTLDHLNRLGPNGRVGLGNRRSGPVGLRVGYFEAAAAARLGNGVQHSGALRLSSVLALSAPSVPLRDLSRMLLRPLLDYDEENGGELVRSLHAYLRLDRAVNPTAEQLFVHRNTLRYRLNQIEELTGLRLDSTADTVDLWIALEALSGH
ncbi:PucR family transcriptional regulator [Pseudonocardia acaciae]|uniref:PucR family transcriptional regulator n=1 Tax=Pseudonocardia acaciae TaxID=551276 RepID=UPI000687FAF5|nr:helix-turn-helix domain-containing protein [Pseudonocardia acaciae]